MSHALPKEKLNFFALISWLLSLALCSTLALGNVVLSQVFFFFTECALIQRCHTTTTTMQLKPQK